MPKISVLMALYNHENFVAEAVDSVLSQTFQDFELIIVDNGCTDKSSDIIRQYRDPRLTIHRFDVNRGGCAAINHCIRTAQGEYLAIMHSDDVCHPDRLRRQAEVLDANPAIAAVFSYTEIINDQSAPHEDLNHPYQRIFIQPQRTRFDWLRHFFYAGNALCQPSAMLRASAQRDIGLYDERLAQLSDFDQWIRLCLKYDIHVIPEKLLRYRVRSGNANESGVRIDTVTRLEWEHRHVLGNYLRISPYDLASAFPEFRNYCPELNASMVAYALARIALDSRQPILYQFGLEIMYQLMDPGLPVNVPQHYAFMQDNFIRATGEPLIPTVHVVNALAQQVQSLQAELAEKDALVSRLQAESRRRS